MQTGPVIRLRQARGVGEVLDETFRFLRQNYVVMGKSVLFIAGPVAVLSSVSGAFMQTFGMAGGLGTTPSAAMGAGAGLAFFLAIVLGLASTVLALAVVLGCVMLYEDYGPGGFDVRDVWAMAKTHFWTLFGALVVLGFLLVVSLVIALIPCLGALAYLVGATYFMVTFSVLFPMLLREEVNIFDGMARCRHLVKGVWWPTFAVMAVAGIVYLLVGSWTSLPYYAVLFVTTFHGIEGGATGPLHGLLLVGTSIVASLGSILLYSVPLTASAFQYFNLVEQKERAGQFMRIEALKPSEDDAPSSEPVFPADAASDGTGEEGTDA